MRRQTREENQNLFDLERKSFEEEIRKIEMEDIMEYEIRKRQDWIQKYKEEHNGKPPDKMDNYDDRLFSENTLEEETALAGAEEDKGKKKGGEKKDVKKVEKGKKDSKKSKQPQEEVNQKKVSVGPSEVVMKFEEFYEDYETVWGKRDETDNITQQWDKKMLRAEVMPQVMDSLKIQIDEMLNVELENMRALMGIK